MSVRRDVKIKNTGLIRSCWFWLCYTILSILISLLIMLFSGSLKIKRNIQTGADLEEFKVHIDERITLLMKVYKIPGCSIALVKDGRIVWTEAYGYADVASGRVLTVDTPMSVQSITKSVTAWGVMRLVEKGLIDLEAPLSQYLKNWEFPQSDYPAENITIGQLLSHTAGMPLGDFTNVFAPGEDMPSNREVMTSEAVLIREPGTGFSYSNTGYNLLELMIEEVTGRSFPDYMLNEILLPLGLETATFNIDTTIVPYPPTGYDLKEKTVPVYLYPSKASGGLFATAQDIARFVLAGLKENPVLSTGSIKRMYQAESKKIGIYGLVFDGYGFGHYIETLPNGLLSISHGGQGNGIMTHFQAVPETGDAIVILTNSQRSWPFIACILRDWAQWRAFPSVGMEKIIWGHYVMSGIIGMLISSCLMMIIGTVMAFCQGKRVKARLLRAITSLILLGILIWCACQKYLFITSVFPVLSMWLGYSVLILSVALFSSALFPLRRLKVF